MVRTLITLPNDIKERLTLLSTELKISFAELIRRALAYYLDQPALKRNTEVNDKYFGSWKLNPSTEGHRDGLKIQRQIRSEW